MIVYFTYAIIMVVIGMLSRTTIDKNVTNVTYSFAQIIVLDAPGVREFIVVQMGFLTHVIQEDLVDERLEQESKLSIRHLPLSLPSLRGI